MPLSSMLAMVNMTVMTQALSMVVHTRSFLLRKFGPASDDSYLSHRLEHIGNHGNRGQAVVH